MYQCTHFLSFTSLNLVFNTVNITWFLIKQHVSRYQMNTGYITGFLKHMSSFQYHFHDLISDFLFYSIMSFRAEWNYKGHSRAEYAWSSDMDSSAAHWCPTFHWDRKPSYHFIYCKGQLFDPNPFQQSLGGTVYLGNIVSIYQSVCPFSLLKETSRAPT